MPRFCQSRRQIISPLNPFEDLTTLKTNTKKSDSSDQKRTARRNPKASKETLIRATLDTIAEIGITDTTVSKIIQKAELSRGMIHLHFGGKDQLLVAAVHSTSIEYYQEVDRRVAMAGNNPADIVMAVIEADLSETLLNERSVRIWHAFRGVARTNPEIARYSSTRDRRLRDMIRGAFDTLAEGGDPDEARVLARDATSGTLALLEGMWVDFMSNTDDFSRPVAVSIVCRFLAGLFPSHFENRRQPETP
ncbi:TetR family transcriptional regulator C-terminal domain-containing protein [Rhodobacteraceae bacterium M382]|nr:TetR family transcriptional regulator C-terminal domain-containing protein [Rhodobacteraceae bacterium M382]